MSKLLDSNLFSALKLNGLHSHHSHYENNINDYYPYSHYSNHHRYRTYLDREHEHYDYIENYRFLPIIMNI
jgi:hypothetical protein